MDAFFIKSETLRDVKDSDGQAMQEIKASDDTLIIQGQDGHRGYNQAK